MMYARWKLPSFGAVVRLIFCAAHRVGSGSLSSFPSFPPVKGALGHTSDRGPNCFCSDSSIKWRNERRTEAEPRATGQTDADAESRTEWRDDGRNLFWVIVEFYGVRPRVMHPTWNEPPSPILPRLRMLDF